MKRKLLVGLVAVLAVIGVVAGAVLAQGLPGQGGPLEGRALWESQGIEHYRFTLSRSCFCLARGPVVIEVRNGKVVSIVDAETGGSEVDGFAVSEIFGDVDTIEELFGRIDAAEGAAVLQVSYDATFGYPAEIYIDQSELMADEEIGYTVSDFEVLG